MSSSSTCSQEHFSYSPAASNASSASDCGSPRANSSPTYNGAFPASSAAAHPPSDVPTMLRKINEMLAHSIQREADNAFNTSNANALGEVIPSGPRKPGQGCEEAHQAIMLAECSPNARCVSLRITLLASGFIIGPIGSCIREITRLSGASIRSSTVQADHLCHRDCREFVIEGPTEASVAHAMSIIVDAVNRYKTLCEGKCAGQVVPRSQHVAGVEFFYQPPPRSIVPFAACLKGHSRRGNATPASCVNKEFVKELPSKTPPPPPRYPASFKAAVVGLNAEEDGQQQRATSGIVPTLRSSPLKRAATSPPASVNGAAAAEAAGSAATAAAEYLSASNRLMASKLTRLNTATSSDGCYPFFSEFSTQTATAAADAVAATAAAMGLPIVSFGGQSNNNGGGGIPQANTLNEQQVLVPLNLLLASQNLLPQQQQQQQQAPAPAPAAATGTYSPSDILAALAAQLQNNLGFTQHAQHDNSESNPFFGHYYADTDNSNNSTGHRFSSNPATGTGTEPAMVSPFASVTTPFQAAGTTAAITTPQNNTPISMASPASVALAGPGGGLGSRSASDMSLFGITSGAAATTFGGVQRNLYQSFSTESDVSNISHNTIIQLGNNNAFNGGRGGGGAGGATATGSAFRSAFALPSFFHGESPLSGTPAVSRSTSLLSQTQFSEHSGLSGDLSLRTSLSMEGSVGAASNGLHSAFGSYLFPNLTSPSSLGEQNNHHHHQQQQQQQQQRAELLTVAAALQQWESSPVPATPATNTTPTTPINNSSNTATIHHAGGGDENSDALYHMLPKSIWSLE